MFSGSDLPGIEPIFWLAMFGFIMIPVSAVVIIVWICQHVSFH